MAKLNYFNECTTLDDAKNLFKKLCFELHPDTSGRDSQTEFVKMFAEFKKFKPQTAREEDKEFNADEFYNTVKRFEGLKNVLVTFVGSFIWLEDEPNHDGSTKAQKEDIKKILLDGFNSPRFSRTRAKWFYSPVGYKQKFRSKKSFDEIRQTWGSKSYNVNDTKPKRRELAY